ncbi:hypothetical protein [Pantoea ananatis]|uniref:hypothetical protein n=1 Tax=Pantoea ananas TaxID=553 RepID=UPI001B300E22|nr:hypothetical protein [Pantoea ananatis]
MRFGDRNKLQGFSKDADQVEFNALIRSAANIDSGLEDEKIAGTFDDEIEELGLDHNAESWATNDQAQDILVGDIAEHIVWRQKKLGDLYPFDYSENHLRLKDDFSKVYIFCLCISMAKNLTKKTNARLPRYFEIIAGDIFTKFISPHARHLHTGWPRSTGNPKSFHKMAKKLRNKISKDTFEWYWQSQGGLKNADASLIKDCGVDFVTWIDFLDGRDGRFFALGQCACGHDWRTKYKDISDKKLNHWFNPISYIDFVKVFTTPHILVDEMMKEVSEEAGITFDRIRLTLAYHKYIGKFDYMNDNFLNLIDFCKKNEP